MGLNVAEHGASSTVIDLANSMYIATSQKNFSEDLEVEVETGTEVGDLASGFNNMLSAVRKAMTESERERLKAFNEREAATSAQKLAKEEAERAEKALQASESAKQSVMDEKSKNAEIVASTAKDLSGILDFVIDNHEQLQNATKAVNHKMGDLQTQSEDIHRILLLFNEISRTSNFLAINAMVEAARAGEHGKSFSVVAEEIQTMSKQTNTAATEIKAIISGMNEELNELIGQIGNQEEGILEGKKSISKVNELLDRLVEIKHSLENHGQEDTSHFFDDEEISA